MLLLLGLDNGAIAKTQQDQGKTPLERFRSRLTAIVENQPRYVCRAIIERTARLSAKGNSIARDRVRLDIASHGSGELYSWPDAGKFEQGEIEQIAQGDAGSMNGVSAWTRTFLALAAAGGTSSGECTALGRHGVKFDFQAPWTSSSYHLMAGARRIVLPYTGSVCADASTLDPIQIKVNAQLPSGPIASVVETVDYRPTQVGSTEALLAVRRELRLTGRDGGQRVNRTEYSAFRPYSAPAAVVAGQKPAASWLPAGIELDVKLENAITFESSAVGDSFTALLQSDIRSGTFVASKATVLIGRVGRLEERFAPGHHFVVGLELLALRKDGAEVRCHARLNGPALKFDKRPESVGGFGDPQYMPPIWDARGLEIDDTDPAAHFGVFRVRATKLKIAPGLHMIWRTLETKPAGAIDARSGASHINK